MRTRCPACNTVFRVTSEQLRLKAGKVRCGHCQNVFNAFDQLVNEAPLPVEQPALIVSEPKPDVVPEVVVEAFAAPRIEVGEPVAAPVESVAEPEIAAEFEPEHASETEIESAEPDTGPETLVPEMSAAELDASDDMGMLPDLVIAAEEHQETPEETTQAAREAGLVAIRELNDPASYNRWSAGTLAGSGLGGFESESAKRAVWPFVLVAIPLCLVLLGQLLFYFRTDIVQRFSGMADLYEMAAVEVPLPRNVELVTIETSDLQSDNQRGMFVLQASLRNRAAFAQAWPDLELTLTDTHDTVVSRRVLAPADYLPPTAPTAAFPANGETAVRIWIEAKDIGAAGYRLYVFYP